MYCITAETRIYDNIRRVNRVLMIKNSLINTATVMMDAPFQVRVDRRPRATLETNAITHSLVLTYSYLFFMQQLSYGAGNADLCLIKNISSHDEFYFRID